MAEAYYRVVGQRTTIEATEATRKSNAAMETGGRATAARTEEFAERQNDKFSPMENKFAARAGSDAGDFRVLQGAGKFGIDEYTAMKAKGTK